MASSFITYNKKGFWTHDYWAEISAYYLSVTISESNINPFWLMDFGNNLKLVTEGNFNGFISFNLDEMLISKVRVKILSDLISQTINKISQNEYLNVEDLIKAFKNSRKIAPKIESARVRNWLQLLNDLITEKKGYLPDETIDYDNWSMNKPI